MAFYKLFKVYHLLLIIGTIMAEKKILNDMERIEKNRQIAESYYAVYSKKTVKDGAVYDKWVFAPHAIYWSPYFGNNKIDLILGLNLFLFKIVLQWKLFHILLNLKIGVQ